MIRICLALGPWQIIMLSAALQQAFNNCPSQEKTKNILVLYGIKLTNELKDSMQTVANLVGEWEQIIWADDLLNCELDKSKQGFNKTVNSLQKRIGIKKAEEIWLCKLTSYSEKLVVEAYQDAKIIIYEDGLHTYVPLNTKKKNLIGFLQNKEPISIVKNYLKQYFNQKISWRRVYKSQFSSEHIHRLSGLYLYIAKDVPMMGAYSKAPQFLIEDETLRDTISSCNSLYTIEKTEANILAGKDKQVLVLGQCFARSGLMNFNEELHIYSQVVETLLEKGYIVLWKDHPRVTEPFFPKLVEKFSSVSVKEPQLSFTLPVEFIAYKLGISACISGFSSSLFYLNRLYGINTYTFAKYLSPYFKNDFSFMVDITNKKIPLFSEIS